MRVLGKRWSRQRKVWASTIATVLATGVVTALAMLLERHRETDLVDASGAVSSAFKAEGSLDAPPIRLRDVAAELGVVMRHGPGARGRTLPEDTGSGIAWGDADGDGDWDLYVVNMPGPLGVDPDPSGVNRLFANEGGRFVDVTAAAGVGDLDGFGMGATFADYDADGDADLLVTCFGPNRLFRNLGDGTFEEVADSAGLADPSWSTGAAWGDFDRDGRLDLYVCNYVAYDDLGASRTSAMATAMGALSVPFTLNPNSFDPQPNRLYRNLGDGTFAEVAVEMGVDDRDGRSLAAALCDLDGDGWLDIYVNNDVSTNRLYRNLAGDLAPGAGFQDMSAITGTADPRGSMGLSIAELGEMAGMADDLPDLFITHWIAQENALYLSITTAGGNLEYRDKTRRFRLGELSIDTVGWGSALVDLDLDGRLDLAVANGSTLEDRADPLRLVPEPLFVLWNDGSQFHQVAPRAGDAVAARHSARGLAAADFDGDGDVDLAVSINRGQPLLLRNDTQPAGRSVTVLLAGPPAQCHGARVTVEVANRQQIRWWGADVSYLGCHAPELVFGLGEAARADRIEVRWLDGTETVEVDVSPGRVSFRHP